MKVTVLGCGTSGGVPQIGRVWGACDPANPRNRRRRCSVLVETRGQTILIDTSPDLREQLIDADLQTLDAVIWTHAHADHLNGIDDLRSVNRLIGKPLDAYADARTFGRIREAFAYTLEDLSDARHFYKPSLIPHAIEGAFAVGRVEIIPFAQDHEVMPTLGFRIGRFAYSTDVVRLPEASFAALAGVEVWIVDALRERPHPTHSHLAQTLAWIARVGPARAFLTHLDDSMDYEAIRRKLPAGVEPAYDGLVITLDDQR